MIISANQFVNRRVPPRLSRPLNRLEGLSNLPSIPEGVRAYAFGDVHGRSDLLAQLRQEVQRNILENAPGQAVVIGLGDYIDRGPDSRGVLDILLQGFGTESTHVFLRGNHEDLLLKFLSDPEDIGPFWFRMGGLYMLHSYGMDIRPYTGAHPDVTAARDELVRVLPGGHLTLLRSMAVSHLLNDYLFVHAGVHNGVPLAEQTTKDLLWRRKGFSDCDKPFEKVVVHGHTPTQSPYFGRYRINLDTAAYATSILSCVVLEGSERRLIQVSTAGIYRK